MLVSRLHAALERLNPVLPPAAIRAAVDELTRDRGGQKTGRLRVMIGSFRKQ